MQETAEEEDLRKREARRQAGQDYFNAVIKQAHDGAADPFVLSRAKSKRHAFEDPDVQRFGAFLEGSKLHLLIGFLIICQGGSLVLLKGALLSISTPAVQTFLHFLSAIGGLLLLSSYDITPKAELTPEAAKASSAQAVIKAAQTVPLFAALMYSSIHVVLTWMLVTQALLEVAARNLWARQQLPRQVLNIVGAAAVAAGLELLVDRQRGVYSVVFLLLWTLAKALEMFWEALKQDNSGLMYIRDPILAMQLSDLAAAESQCSAASLALYRHALPAVPVLLLGFVTREGQELVEHEPSVPGLTVVLLSCLVFTLAAALQLLLHDKLHQRLTLLVQGGTCAVAMLLDFLERGQHSSWLAILCTSCAASASLAASWHLLPGPAATSAPPTGVGHA